MARDAITRESVASALHAIRYDQSLSVSELLDLDLVTLALRTDGLADTPRGREWALARCLDHAVVQRLADLRGDSIEAVRAEPSPKRELRQLRADEQSGSRERSEWGLLHARYISPVRLSVNAISASLGLSRRAVYKRVTRACLSLSGLLQESELAATPELESTKDTDLHERIVIDEQAKSRGVFELLGELQALLGSDGARMHITPAQLDEMAHYPSAEWDAYRLGRIAEWSQPRYRLDTRFVDMSLLIDLGEESLSGRWRARDERFTDLRDVLAEASEPAVVLLGPPGSGKSTLLRRLEMDLAIDALGSGEDGSAVLLTFFVSLNQYGSAEPDEPPPVPREWLAERWTARFPKLPSLEAVAAERGIVYLLDGLNEMPQSSPEGHRSPIALWKQFLHDEVTAGSGNRAVIACRSLDYSAPLSTPAMRVAQVRLEPLTDDKTKEFLARYCPARAESLWSELQNTDLLGAVRWPYFLRLLVEASQASGEMPHGPAALFTSFVRRALVREVERDNPRFLPGGLIESHDYARVASGQGWRTSYELPKRSMLFRKLSELAFGMQATGIDGEASQVRISYDDALTLVDGSEAEEIIRAGRDLGVLDEDRAADHVMFQHQLIQEYFAARQLAAKPDPALVRVEWRAAAIRPSIDEVIDGLDPADPLPSLPGTGWEETTILAAEMTNDPASFLGGIVETNLALAGRVVAQAKLVPLLTDEALDELRWALVERSRDPEADLRDRIACGRVVGDLGDPRFERRAGPHGEYLMPPLVTIPGGTYPIGDDEPICDVEGVVTAHSPRHELPIAEFRIGQFAVTNAEWAYFQRAEGYDNELWWESEADRAWRRGEHTAAGLHTFVRSFRERLRARPEIAEEYLAAGSWTEERYEREQRQLKMTEDELDAFLTEMYPGGRFTEPNWWRRTDYTHPTQPVIGVCWHEARAYCAWLSAQTRMSVRLPSEIEWEAAARGIPGRRYACGDTFDRLKGNIVETHVQQTAPIGVFPGGDTPEGVCDMSGGVLEWTSSGWGTDLYEPDFRYPYDALDGREETDAQANLMRVARGGSLCLNQLNAIAANRRCNPPDHRDHIDGFRIVVELPVDTGR